jgi:hypothetical protein
LSPIRNRLHLEYPDQLSSASSISDCGASTPAQRPLGRNLRDIYIPDMRLRSGIGPDQPTKTIKIKPRLTVTD